MICSSNNCDHRSQHGFTLVEVMVALLVVAVSISALLFQMGGNIDNTVYLRDKTIAHWVALNQLELIYLENQKTNQLIGRDRTGTSEMAGRDWFWKVKPKQTQAEDFVQLEVTVKANENDDSSLITVTGIIDRFHKPK